MNRQADALVEIGTEELPPKALRRLAEAFHASLLDGLAGTGLTHGPVRWFATPRRLALLVSALADEEPERETLRKGPALKAAFDAEGKPTRAAEGFARSCGVGVEELDRDSDAKGEYLVWRSREPGRPVAALLPALVTDALAALPIPRRMRWGAGEAEFVRPVHWVVMLYGDTLIEANILGVAAGRTTQGHRFHAPGAISLDRAADYERVLREQGHVIADFQARREQVRAQVVAAGQQAGGQALIGEALLDEVTALVEWPVPVPGSFEERFLELPREVLIATMQDHQRYFPVLDAGGRLLAKFVTVANIDSRRPEAIAAGNERVIRPRLSDAAFFFDADLRHGLDGWRTDLDRVVYQDKLGSLGDKTRRLGQVAQWLAAALGADADATARAAELSRCDLMSAMVGEFPELQGVMGRCYAARAGEPERVTVALDAFYSPRHAGDALPATPEGQAIAIADRLDTLVGIFGIGMRPSGDRDPYALRRAALGVLRTCIEQHLDIDLAEALDHAAAAYAPGTLAADTATDVLAFMLERLRAYYLDAGHGPDVFEAVLARRPTRPLDFHQRMQAVSAFKALPAAASLSAANKRIANILRKAGESDAGVPPAPLQEAAEQALAAAVGEADTALARALAAGDYAGALEQLAGLRAPVDRFFDDIMVMCEDPSLRASRLGLLQRLHGQFLQIADIALLQS